jgi:predicted phosphodiesterase
LIYVTGDTHGNIERFKERSLKKLKKRDTLIVCGDFGFIWDNSRLEKSNLRKLSELRYTVAFVDGCHENFDLLSQYPIVDWNGGKAQQVCENVFHLMRGQVYTIDGTKFFTFGGGHSDDIEIRKETQSWYAQEEPTPEEVLEGVNSLIANDYNVDFVITHEPPSSIKMCLDIEMFHRLEFDSFFEQIKENCTFKHWFFGKCHENKFIPPKFSALFDEVVKLDSSYDD